MTFAGVPLSLPAAISQRMALSAICARSWWVVLIWTCTVSPSGLKWVTVVWSDPMTVCSSDVMPSVSCESMAYVFWVTVSVVSTGWWVVVGFVVIGGVAVLGLVASAVWVIGSGVCWLVVVCTMQAMAVGKARATINSA